MSILGKGDLGMCFLAKKWWRDPELNWGHGDFQSPALPPELSRHLKATLSSDLYNIAWFRIFSSLSLEIFYLMKINLN